MKLIPRFFFKSNSLKLYKVECNNLPFSQPQGSVSLSVHWIPSSLTGLRLCAYRYFGNIEGIFLNTVWCNLRLSVTTTL